MLHLACENNNVCEVKALLTFPDLEINATDNQGWTALHVAAFRGHIDCVRELLSLKKSGNLVCPNTRAKELQNQTPLMYAVSQGHADVCTALLEHTGWEYFCFVILFTFLIFFKFKKFFSFTKHNFFFRVSAFRRHKRFERNLSRLM